MTKRIDLCCQCAKLLEQHYDLKKADVVSHRANCQMCRATRWLFEYEYDPTPKRRNENAVHE